jgi:hypothetical protein
MSALIRKPTELLRRREMARWVNNGRRRSTNCAMHLGGISGLA